MAEVLVLRTEPLDREIILAAARALLSGGIVAYPTDTFYGLAADPRDRAALTRLFAVKERDPGQAVPLIAAAVEQAEEAVVFTDVAHRLAARFWPGPLSLVLPARPALDRTALGGRDTAAVRVPAHPVACALAAAAGCCITATSANISGAPPARSVSELGATVLERLAAVIDAGVTPGGAPSTIVDLTGDAPRLVRAGAIAWERVLESLQ
jgi:L-threonylcarbamoyladenylate synthase